MLKVFLGLGSILTIVALYFSAQSASDALSPEGCRMSWMSPSYVLQTGFNSSWSPLGDRYSLWLYREVGWNRPQIGNSLPVLFIPGNAGSSHQVRSIASSTARQYYGSPGKMSPDFASRTDEILPLDVYAVDFNEDLSAFHGTTLKSQIQYTKQAISYILSLYPPGTRILVLGHSMGGIVAASLLPANDISAIITMAAPYSLPPARFDSSIDAIYSKLHETVRHDPTPIVSLCGGAADKMIPSESCILPASNPSVYRRTIFSSALEGSWTGVGHDAMVWCHQVRWRVARAALELAPRNTHSEVASVLDRWIRDGHTISPAAQVPPPLQLPDNPKAIFNIPLGESLVLFSGTTVGSAIYRMYVPKHQTRPTLTILLSRGTIDGIGPHRPLPFTVSIYKCEKGYKICNALQPTSLRLVPNPVPGEPFPVPKGGVDESSGVVLFEADLGDPAIESILIHAREMHGDSWLAAGIEERRVVEQHNGMISLLTHGISTPLHSPQALKHELYYPNLLSHTLVAYRLTAVGSPEPNCSTIVFPPLLVHESNPAEIHYFPLRVRSQRKTVLHTHSPAPFIPSPRDSLQGLRFRIYSSGLSECTLAIQSVEISIDWPTTLSRWATRYWMSVLSWTVGVVTLNIAFSMDRNGNIAPVSLALGRYIRRLLPRLLGASALLSVVPFSKTLYLGNGGEPWFCVIAPLVLLVSSGLVVTMWWILSAATLVLRKARSALPLQTSPRPENSSVSRNTIASIALLFLAIFLFIPWQVAFLGCWVYHFYTCSAPIRPIEARDSPRRSEDNAQPKPRGTTDQAGEIESDRRNTRHFNDHLLLLMTWLLPLVAPILAVWVKTLITAGLTIPFDGDHNFLNVAPFLILVDFASWTPNKLFVIARFERWISARWLFAAASIVAFVFGSRNTYVVYRAVAVVIGILVATKVCRRYWRG